jgi:MFS family permease
MVEELILQRRKALSGNFRRMFFIQAFQSVRTLNVVVVLFYLARGLDLSQVFYLSIFWAVINILFEIPSSYLADRWGRKKTIVLSTTLYFMSSVLLIFSHSFLMFGLSIFIYALSYACFSGTDEALVYDTDRELGENDSSLRRLGQYAAAEKIFKIATPLVGAFIAKDLVEWQFVLLLIIDSSAALCAMVISIFLVEPKHRFEVEKVEAGVFRDAVKLIKNNPNMMLAICNRGLMFTSVFVVWRYHQELFTHIGTSILVLGIGWSVFHLLSTILSYNIHRLWPKISLTIKINFLNLLTIFFICLFILGLYFELHYYWILLFYFCFNFTENARWPIFSDLFNKYSSSFNRATTLSLSNFIKSIFDIPMLLVASLLILYNLVYPAYFIFVIMLLTTIIFYLPKKLKFENKF